MSELVFPPPYPRQVEFFKANARYIAYGGARSGGKSWAARVKACLLCLSYPGIQVLLLRRTFAELQENHTLPLQAMLRQVAEYREKLKAFVFPNGSRLKLGYLSAERDVLQYQGQAYDVMFLEEATQFTEFQFQALTESNRASGGCKKEFSPRMYLTCNPGGVGHGWVKRLFVDRDYRGSERPEDYVFIKATVYDNPYMLEHDPGYVRVLENLPEKRRRAMLNGDWDAVEGQFFGEFDRDVHVVKPFPLPTGWRRYAALDYGLDMFACYFIAVDEQGRAYVYREIYESGLIVSQAAERLAAAGEPICQVLAPPDLWNRHSDTGRSTADIFADHGIVLARASNDRVQGWYDLREWLRIFPDEQGQRAARLRIFENCRNLIRTLPLLQHDEDHPGDCARQPHEYTHAPDAIRYFVCGRPRGPESGEKSRYYDQLESFLEYGT